MLLKEIYAKWVSWWFSFSHIHEEVHTRNYIMFNGDVVCFRRTHCSVCGQEIGNVAFIVLTGLELQQAISQQITQPLKEKQPNVNQSR